VRRVLLRELNARNGAFFSQMVCVVSTQGVDAGYGDKLLDDV